MAKKHKDARIEKLIEGRPTEDVESTSDASAPRQQRSRAETAH
jgi:hypothetical protein